MTTKLCDTGLSINPQMSEGAPPSPWRTLGDTVIPPPQVGWTNPYNTDDVTLTSRDTSTKGCRSKVAETIFYCFSCMSFAVNLVVIVNEGNLNALRVIKV